MSVGLDREIQLRLPSCNSVLALMKDDKKAVWTFITTFLLAQRLGHGEQQKTVQLGSDYSGGHDIGLYHSPLGA